MDVLTAALPDEWTLNLLARVVALTIFYAALCWIPLRGTAIVLRRLQARRERQRREALLRSVHGLR